MNKRILVLKVCGNLSEISECNGICEHAKLYGLEVVCKDVRSNDELKSVLSSNGSFDYIYLSAHGCAERFGSEDKKVNMDWDEFSSILCDNNTMKDNCILMLSCCRGGLIQIAYTLFLNCSKICYVLGPRQSLDSADMHICFGVFLYNMEIRNTDPIVACEKVKLATDQRFSCYDRQEEDMNLVNYLLMDEIHKRNCSNNNNDNNAN